MLGVNRQVKFVNINGCAMALVFDRDTEAGISTLPVDPKLDVTDEAAVHACITYLAAPDLYPIRDTEPFNPVVYPKGVIVYNFEAL